MTTTVETGRRQKVAAAAYRMRHHVLDMGEAQGQGYVGQALDAADMLACVYADQLRYRADDPHREDRDRLLCLPATTPSGSTPRSPRPASSTSPNSTRTARMDPLCRCPEWPATHREWKSPADRWGTA